MSTQKELVKQKLDLLTKVPYEFIVASYNLAVSNNFIESTNFYGNSECPRSKEVERFKTIISPLFLLSDNDKRRELNESARSELVEFFKNYVYYNYNKLR